MRRSRKRTFIYLATNAARDVLKIGFSKNPLIRDLKNICGFGMIKRGDTIKFLYVTKGDREMETKLHQKFREYRRAGREWYYFAPEIVEYFYKLPDLMEAARVVKQDYLDRQAKMRWQALARPLAVNKTSSIL